MKDMYEVFREIRKFKEPEEMADSWSCGFALDCGVRPLGPRLDGLPCAQRSTNELDREYPSHYVRTNSAACPSLLLVVQKRRPGSGRLFIWYRSA
jgi:hypothetical protein